ncbi:nitronate monooxygenase [Streptomyces sp. NPDC007875]|uniref:nitronate monooxygenase n=1 Tax=Streptomyces sp. NPDC007875 TaxID=3364783 RepID=UPI003685A226
MASTSPAPRTRFTELVGCTVPVQQAGMGWVSGVDLAAAVSEAGGLGMVAFPMATPEALTGLVRRRTTRPVGVDFILPVLQDQACVDIAAERMSAVEFFWAAPSPRLVARGKAGGALAAWQVGSVAEAQETAEAGCGMAGEIVLAGATVPVPASSPFARPGPRPGRWRRCRSSRASRSAP